MQTMKETPYQTLIANAKRLAELANWYATTAAAETLEAGRQTKTEAAEYHRRTGLELSSEAIKLQAMSASLDRYLANRRAAESAPAIEKARA